MLKQKSILEVEIAGKLVQLLCENDMPLGALHDALMHLKGYVVDRMNAAHSEEQAASDKLKSIEVEEEKPQE